MRTSKQVRVVGRKTRVAAWVIDGDGTIRSVRQENEVRRMESRPLLMEAAVQIRKEAVRHG